MVWPLLTANIIILNCGKKKLVPMLFNILMVAITKLKNVKHSPNGSTFTLVSPKGSIEINLPYLGEHNVKNALAATALAMNVGASLADVKQVLNIALK